MITFQVERLTDELIDEIEPLIRAHYEEIATDKDVKALDPDWHRYYRMQQLEQLRIVTARDDRRRNLLVGYFATFIIRHMHYQETITALNDVLYLSPELRGSTAAYRLFRVAEADLRELGAHILIIHMKVDYPFRNLLTRLGFHLTEENWELVL